MKGLWKVINIWGRKIFGKSLVFYFIIFPPKAISQGQRSLSNLVVSILIQRTILRLVGLDLYWASKPSTQTCHSLKDTWPLSINMNLINRTSDALITLRRGSWPVFCLFLCSFSLIQHSCGLCSWSILFAFFHLMTAEKLETQSSE